MLERCILIYFGFLYFYQKNYKKLVCNCSDEFEQVDGGRLINMRNLFSAMFCFSFNAMYLGRNNGNISETKKTFSFTTFSQNKKSFA